MTYKKKLIEVALPLEAINAESAREKSIRHGHPSTLHLWWARRPLAACRAVLFASLVDDPSSLPAEFPTEESQEKERQRLFRIIEDLVKWENINNETVLAAAKVEIHKSTGGNPPPVYDPFCGGGSIPLEAQRLGLEAHASDLNPVAVLINKALIEIPPKFAGMPPVNPKAKTSLLKGGTWKGAQGLAEDVRYYGQWIRDEGEKRIGHLYPKAILPDGSQATVIAWLWARTVKCPNPACGAQMPLVRSFALATKKGKEAWVEPMVTPGIDGKPPVISFEVKTGKLDQTEAKRIGFGTSVSNEKGKKVKASFQCPACGNGVAKGDYIDSEANVGRMGAMGLSVVVEGKNGRNYLSFDQIQTAISTEEVNQYIKINQLESKFPNEPAKGTFASNAQGRIYGFKVFSDYFTSRQLVALTTFTDLVEEAHEKVLVDTENEGIPPGQAQAYADAVRTYLGFGISKLADYNSSLVMWSPTRDQAKSTFARQALPMCWDYSEVNVFAQAAGDLQVTLRGIGEAIERGFAVNSKQGLVNQKDATSFEVNNQVVFCTDPPYYDNIGYADLSDFFYVWLRRSLKDIYPDILGTLLVPKAQELVATPYRFGGDKQKAQEFFETGLGKTFGQMRKGQHPDFPLTVYYAFKQSETEEDSEETDSNANVSSTGWETMLEGLIQAGFSINGTWPVRTERGARSISIGTNALASSIVLVCRPRPVTAPMATRREFLNALKRELPPALRNLQHGNIAPVDFAQATIGPGMAVFSHYAQVLEADGNRMSVRTALQIINQELDAYLAAQEGEMDGDTRFCLTWFEQYGSGEGPFGEADVLARAKNTSTAGLVEAGVLHSRAGKVRLLKREEMPDNWDPTADDRVTIWECVQHLIKRLDTGGEQAAARLVNRLGGGRAENARALAYRLYALCERKKWAEEALAYNMLVVSWPAIQDQAAQVASVVPTQGTLFG
ncbi:MAG: DUF1156 domain-containing protein [Blastocatellia bacterium]|nr:DUF1156 domain-containing protein [Blastocatellia bacterium]